MAAEAGARAAGFTDKTGWRSRRPKQPDPAPDVAPDVAAADDATEEAPLANDDAVELDDEEAEEADISGLLGDRDAEPRDPDL